MKTKNIALSLFLLLSSMTSAFAAAVDVEFPSLLSTNTASGGEFYFNPSHTVRETFVSTGLDYADGLDLSLLVDNRLINGAFVDFDVSLNGILVGSFSIAEADGGGPLDFSFGFSPIAGPSFEILFAVTNTVPGGDGSVNFIEGESFATIIGVVPSPATVALLGLGLLVAGLRVTGTKRS